MSLSSAMILVGGAAMFGLLAVSCARENGEQADQIDDDEPLRQARREMVALVRRYGVKDERVLGAMLRVRRHLFIPEKYRALTNPYGDHPCAIGYGQTISQPYIVAYMTDRLKLRPDEKVLEVGTGSGYQAAVLAELGVTVATIEIIPELAEHARRVLVDQGYTNVTVRAGDGYKGWPEKAPFDAVIVTCAPESVPRDLVNQLREGGRMIVPVGDRQQRLVILRKRKGKIVREEDLPVRFVPMVHGSKSP